MIVLGKKCPACASNRLSARETTSRLTAIPGVETCMCMECKQQILVFFSFSMSVEHRNSARKKLPPYMLVRLPGQFNQFARIKNISEGGICFDQHCGATPPDSGSFLLDLYNCNDGSSLEQLPAKIVASYEQQLDINGVRSTVVNNCARFVQLNQAQKKVLCSCIDQHGIA